jgi:hypothetical protein
MSIRAPTSCSRCGLFGHNKRRCHEILQDDEQRERRSNENLEKHEVINHPDYETATRRRDRERRQQEELQQLREERSHNEQHIIALQNRIHGLQQQQPRRPLRRSDSFVLTQDQVMTYILHQGNEYKKLLTGPEVLKTPHLEVYVSESCPICMESLGKTNVTTMLCGHQTCTGCFSRNIIESKSNRCPVCREKVI